MGFNQGYGLIENCLWYNLNEKCLLYIDFIYFRQFWTDERLNVKEVININISNFNYQGKLTKKMS